MGAKILLIFSRTVKANAYAVFLSLKSKINKKNVFDGQKPSVASLQITILFIGISSLKKKKTE